MIWKNKTIPVQQWCEVCGCDELFFEIGRAGNNFRSGPENSDFLDMRLPLPDSNTPKSSWGGV